MPKGHDQRFKAFNYFVILVGILVVAYGNAMKEGVPNSAPASYKVFASAIAVCGMFASIAFLLIEFRNTELVDCGRDGLDTLEKDITMHIRQDDHDRKFLAFGKGLPLLEYVIKHQFWFRSIYILAIFGFMAATAFPWLFWGR